jgi:hypothetical protein
VYKVIRVCAGEKVSAEFCVDEIGEDMAGVEGIR